jgi:hypothetical protein
MSRLLPAGTVIYDMAEIFFPAETMNRVAGLTYSSVTPTLFVNNSPLNWTIADGTSIQSGQIFSGKIYFNEIPGNPGFYSIRLLPDRMGFWRLVLNFASYDTEFSADYDVIPAGAFTPGASSGGLTASFLNNSTC